MQLENWVNIITIIGGVLTILGYLRSMKNELRNEFRKEITDTTSSLKKEIIDTTSSLRKEIIDTTSSLRKEITDKTSSLRKEITDTTSSLRKEITDTTSSLRKEIIEIKTELKEIKHAISSLDRRITRIEDRLEFSNKIVYIQKEEEPKEN
jgi:chromosome segregation ATPase